MHVMWNMSYVFCTCIKYCSIMGSCNSEERNSTNCGYKRFTGRLFLDKKWTILTSLPVYSSYTCGLIFVILRGYGFLNGYVCLNKDSFSMKLSFPLLTQLSTRIFFKCNSLMRPCSSWSMFWTRVLTAKDSTDF